MAPNFILLPFLSLPFYSFIRIYSKSLIWTDVCICVCVWMRNIVMCLHLSVKLTNCDEIFQWNSFSSNRKLRFVLLPKLSKLLSCEMEIMYKSIQIQWQQFTELIEISRFLFAFPTAFAYAWDSRAKLSISIII